MIRNTPYIYIYILYQKYLRKELINKLHKGKRMEEFLFLLSLNYHSIRPIIMSHENTQSGDGIWSNLHVDSSFLLPPFFSPPFYTHRTLVHSPVCFLVRSKHGVQVNLWQSYISNSKGRLPHRPIYDSPYPQPFRLYVVIRLQVSNHDFWSAPINRW